MDHHCIWINNCVGHNNYKAFILFVFYAVAASTYSLVLLAGHAIKALGNDEHNGSESRPLPVNSLFESSVFWKVLCATVLTPLSIALIVLFGWHIYLTVTNKTTIEYHEGVRARWLAEKAGQVYKHPYDVGPFSNIIAVLGPNAVSWLCPTAVGHISSGMRFQTFYDSSTWNSDEREPFR